MEGEIWPRCGRQKPHQKTCLGWRHWFNPASYTLPLEHLFAPTLFRQAYTFGAGEGTLENATATDYSQNSETRDMLLVATMGP